MKLKCYYTLSNTSLSNRGAALCCGRPFSRYFSLLPLNSKLVYTHIQITSHLSLMMKHT